MSALLKLIPAWAWVALIGLKLIRVHDVRAQMAKAEAISRATGEKLIACRVTRTNLLEQTIDH